MRFYRIRDEPPDALAAWDSNGDVGKRGRWAFAPLHPVRPTGPAPPFGSQTPWQNRPPEGLSVARASRSLTAHPVPPAARRLSIGVRWAAMAPVASANSGLSEARDKTLTTVLGPARPGADRGELFSTGVLCRRQVPLDPNGPPLACADPSGRVGQKGPFAPSQPLEWAVSLCAVPLLGGSP